MKTKIFAFVCLVSLLAASVMLFPQDRQGTNSFTDQASVSVGRPRLVALGTAAMPHPYHIEARHWPAGCEQAKANFNAYGVVAFQTVVGNVVDSLLHGKPGLPSGGNARNVASDKCGDLFLSYDGENLTTSAGETAISKAMSDTAAQPASANYIALTNTAITAAVGDTSLSGEIVSNGLQRAQGTFTDTSAAIGTPPTPGSLATVGTSGATSIYYWVFACTYQGCTAVGSSANLASSNATLSTSNYNTGSFTGKLGAAFYRVIRTHNSTTPSGALAGGSCATMTTAGCDGEISTFASCTDLVAGTAPTCAFADTSNVLTAFTVPGSDQTFVGKYTLTKTFTATGTQAAQAFGILNAASTGTLYFEGTFTQASLVTNDTLAFTETVYHALDPKHDRVRNLDPALAY
jgi:hypothetical protein